MDKIPFIIKDLHIRKMPGLKRGLKKFANMSPHINIIAGPNASGKSSTARMIRQIIRRNDTTRLHAESEIHIDQEPWYINIDSRHVTLQRNGIDDQLTGLPPAEAQDRYMLAFHELVNHNEQDLAKQIVREAVGGYDLDQAQNDLNYSDRITSQKVSQFNTFQKAEKKYKEVRDQQKNLKNQEEKLDQLYRDQEQAKEADRLRELYQRVQEWLAEKQPYQLAKEKLEAYPAVMGRLTGEEYKQIESLEGQMAEAQQKADQAGNRIKECQKTLSQLSLPEEGIGEDILTELEEKVDSLENTGRNIDTKHQEISEAQTNRDKALEAIGKSLDPNQWKSINLEDMAGLQEFLDQAIKTHTEKQFLETELHGLKQESQKHEDGDPYTLRQGIQNLSLWLQEQTHGGISRNWTGWMALAGVLTAGATWLFGAIGLLGIAAIILIALLAMKKPAAGKVNTRQEDYRRTGLDEPPEWNVEQVTQWLNHLSEKLSTLQYKEKIDQKIQQRKEDLEKLKPRLDEVQQTHQAWLDKLKAAPDLPQKDVKEYKGLYWFLIHVQEWQEKHVQLEALTAQKEQLEEKYGHLLREINDLFSQHHARQAGDNASARGILNKLKREEQTRQTNTREIDQLKNNISDYKKQVENKKQGLREVYNKLGLEEGQKDRVRDLVEQLEDYKKVQKEYDDQASRLKVKWEQVESHSLYDGYKQEIEALAPDRVDERIEQNRQEASELDRINQEISEIRTNIKNTSSRNHLEKALQEKEQALTDLEELYQTNLASLTGNILVEQLKKETQEENQTPVFKRANELFSRITRGRYELRVEEKGEPLFKAFDTVLNLGQHLDELSTGTRIQLLLAVRLAFIETQESTLKLPILADELLANSDDARASAIIDALVEISRDGRQVFYFTAQGDEVAKWKDHLERVNHIPYEIFEITGENMASPGYQNTEPAFGHLELTGHQVPAPEGKSHEQYGKELEVPPFNPVTDNIESLHLWYLVEDISLLHNCLSMSISYWGQLKSFRESNGQIKGLDEASFEHLNQKARVLERFQELYQQGRAYPINRDVLEASGAVTPKFIDKVTEKMKHLNYQPESLLRALRNREVPKFFDAKADELEEYLYSQGYLKEEKALTRNDILVRIQAMVSNMDISRNEAERMINRLLDG